MKKKIILSIIALVILIICIILIITPRRSKVKGDFEIIIIKEEIVLQEIVTFEFGDTLADIIEEKYNAIIGLDGFMTSLYGITPNRNKEYFAIYINDKYSNFGVKDIELKPNMVVKFEFTVWN